MSSFDIAHFKETVGHFATGVAIVTAATTDGPAGFTCQTFGSLSLEPIMVSFAAGRGGCSWPRVHAVGRLGINVMADDQETIARVFATSGAEKFLDVEWLPGPSGSPLLGGALAHFEGRLVSVVTHGDHDLAVVAIDFAVAHPGRPLLYYRGGFNGLA